MLDIQDIITKYNGFDSKSKSLLFYYSLLDYPMFTESGFEYRYDRTLFEIKKFFRKKFRIKTSSMSDSEFEIFVKTNLFTSKINNSIISTEIDKRLMTSSKASAKWDTSEIDCVLPKYKIFMETKRLYSAGNIGDYIVETIDKYKDKELIYRTISVTKVLLNLVFLADNSKDEDTFHKRTTLGYRSIFSKFTERGHIPKFMEFNTSYFYKEKDIDTFFNDLCARIKSLNSKE